MPDLFSEFDTRCKDIAGGICPAILRAAFGDSGLQGERIFWWGRWLVPLLRAERSSTRSGPGRLLLKFIDGI